MRRLAFLFAVTLLLVVPATSAAAQTLALSDAKTEARAHAPEGAELEARLRGADAVLDDAGRVFRRDPTMQANYSTGALTGSPDEHAATVGIRLPVDISGSWTPRAGSARADRDRARYEREDGLRALDEAVAIAFADVALAQRLVGRAERVVTLHELALDAERERLRVGQGNQLDVDAADLDAQGARASVAQARGLLAQARARLARLLGRESAADLSVEDPTEPAAVPSESVVAGIVDRDPRVRAADADARSRSLAVEMYDRLMIPTPTLGVDVGWRRRDIPGGAFQGPASPGLSALWSEWEMGFSLSVPLPLFDGSREPRARALSLSYVSSARVATVRADVRSELEQAWSVYKAAAEAHQALVPSAAIIDRDFGLLEQAVRTGAMDAVARATSLRRLEDAGRRLDVAVRDVRVAHARWDRRVAARTQ